VAHPCGFVSCKGGVFLLSLFQFLFSIFRQSRAELACGEVFQGAGEKGKLETRRQKLESGGKYAEWRVVGGEWREEEKGGAKRDSSLRRPTASLGMTGEGKSVRKESRGRKERVFPV